MRFKEVWSDWRGGRSARQVIFPGANAEECGSARTGAMALESFNNRYLSWYCCGNVLELTEMSLDENLSDNAVDIVLLHNILPLSVTACEIDDVVIVTFVTTAQIYWIELPHPQTIITKDMSMLNSITVDTIRRVSHGVTLTVDTITSSIVSREWMCIVCNSKDGIMFMLPPHGEGNNVTTVEVAASSKGVVQRMWQGLLSSSTAMATDSIIDVVLYTSADDLLAIASCRDNLLRLFSYKQQRVIMTYSLSEYVTGDNPIDVVAMVRTGASTVQSMKFAIFLSSLDRNKVLIFTMTSSHDLDLIYSTSLSPEYSLMRWQLGDKEIWLILTDGDGDTIVKHAVYKCGSSSVFKDVAMKADPELILSDHLTPQECYLDHITLHYPTSVIRSVIMSMQSSEMGSHDLSNMANIRSAMCHLVEAEIKQQVFGSCEPQEYRLHQITQWGRLLGYIRQFHDEQLRPPAGLFIDKYNGFVLLLGRQCTAVMIPCTNPIDLVVMETVMEKDVNIVLQCVSMVTKMVTSDDKLEYCFHDDFVVTAAAIADNIVARGNVTLLAEFKERINDIQNVTVAMETLVDYFLPSCKDVDEGGNDPESVPLGESLYASDVAVVTMVTTLRQFVSTRMNLCKQVMIMFHLHKLVCSQYFNQPDRKVVNSLSNLLKCYHGIWWLTVAVSQTSQYSVDIDTTLGRLDISDKLPRQQSVMELLLRGRLGSMVRKLVARRLPANDRMKNSWRRIMPLFINATIEKVWNSWSVVCDLLLSNHQYVHAQTYLSLLPSKHKDEPLYQFLLAHSLLCSEPDKSCDLFIGAVAMGISHDDELCKHCYGDDESCNPLLMYYRKVISLMQQMSSPVDHVIQILKNALKSVNDSVFQSLLFKLYLQLNQYEAAYIAMVAITDSSRRVDCLRHFVTVLIDEHQWGTLCSLPFAGLDNEVEGIIEARARSLDMSAAHSCYELLYSYHVSHSNYRKGATVMYEAAHRTGIEVTSDLSTDVAIQYCKQRDYYVVSLCCLKLCSHDYQWLVRPSTNDKEDLEVVTYHDISKEYQLVCAKCELLRQHPDASLELPGAHMSPQEVISLLLQCGMFDVAFQLGRSLELPLDTIYDNLAGRCVSLTKSFATIQKLKVSGNSQSDYFWQWVECNDPETTVNTREMTVVDNAWLLLRKHLMTDNDCRKYQSCVTKRIVAMGGTLPQWLVDHYKRSDTAGLLRILISHSMLDEALSVAMEYIDAALGQGAEYFDIDTKNPVTWLPHNTFGCLSTALDGMSQKLELLETYKKFEDKWNQYLQAIEY